METKVKFVACDMPEATPFMLHIYAASLNRKRVQFPLAQKPLSKQRSREA
jgi:hypothetical protein